MAKGMAQGLPESDGIIFHTFPSGKYEARITKIEDVVSGPNSSHPGTPMVQVSHRLISDDEAVNGKIVFSNVILPGAEYMSEEEDRRATATLARYYMACGVEIPSDGSYDTDDWMGYEHIVVVTEKNYKGKPVNNVSDVLPLNG